jgi:hypothetical protein
MARFLANFAEGITSLLQISTGQLFGRKPAVLEPRSLDRAGKTYPSGVPNRSLRLVQSLQISLYRIKFIDREILYGAKGRTIGNRPRGVIRRNRVIKLDFVGSNSNE